MSNFPGFGDVQGIIVKIAYAKKKAKSLFHGL